MTESHSDEQQQETGVTTDPGDADEQQQGGDAADDETDADTFPREYVQRLRGEARNYRQQAQAAGGQVETLQRALWAQQVEASGRLADPTDLDMPAGADPLDGEQVTAAIDDLLQRKPHLIARRATGDIGQHNDTGGADSFSLLGTMQRNA